jgi:hypothetical protein
VTLGKEPSRSVTTPVAGLELFVDDPVFALLPHAASTSESATVIARVKISGRRLRFCTSVLQDVTISTKEVDKIE